MTKENSTINIFVNPDQPEICGLYSAFDSSNLSYETNTPDYISNINHSNLNKEKIVNMDQTNYFQEYQSKFRDKISSKLFKKI
jgi:hypothetical protein